MIALPHSTHDLMLAPVVLAVNGRIEQLSRLSVDELAYEVALESDTPDYTIEFRRRALLSAIERGVDLHDWELAWDGKDLRLSGRRHHVVLGVPPQFLAFLEAGADRGLRQ